MRRFSFSWSLAAEAIRLATFSSKEPWLLIGLLAASTVPPYVELANRGRPTRVYRAAHGAFCRAPGRSAGRPSSRRVQSAPAPWWACVPLMAAVLVRCGTVPAHCWVTDWFEHASFGIALLFVLPLAGVYAAIRLVLPIAPDWVLRSIGAVSLFTAVYAAGMAVIQRDDAAILRPPVPEPRVARAGRSGAAHRAVADRVALPLVLGDPVAGRLRPDAPGPRGPVRPALAHRLPRPVRALAHAGRLLPAHRPGQRRVPGHARLHLDRAPGRQRDRGQSLCRHRRLDRVGLERDRGAARLFAALHRCPARLVARGGDQSARAVRGADPVDADPPGRNLPPARRDHPRTSGGGHLEGPCAARARTDARSPERIRSPNPLQNRHRGLTIGVRIAD